VADVLKRHHFTHSGYKCNACDYRASCKGSLTAAHLATHSAVMSNVVCNNATSSRRNNLRSQEETQQQQHRWPPTFQCEMCGFSWESELCNQQEKSECDAEVKDNVKVVVI
jgi:hypothetical protein